MRGTYNADFLGSIPESWVFSLNQLYETGKLSRENRTAQRNRHMNWLYLMWVLGLQKSSRCILDIPSWGPHSNRCTLHFDYSYMHVITRLSDKIQNSTFDQEQTQIELAYDCFRTVGLISATWKQLFSTSIDKSCKHTYREGASSVPSGPMVGAARPLLGHVRAV